MEKQINDHCSYNTHITTRSHIKYLLYRVEHEIQMMDDECRGVRHRKKQADPTCCPVCGITVRAHEMEQHYSMEMDRLQKLSVHKNRKSQSKDMMMLASAFGGCSGGVASTSASTSNTDEAAVDEKDCWNTYQRIKNNRSARLKVSHSAYISRKIFDSEIDFNIKLILSIK